MPTRAAKLGGTASPLRGRRRSWPELVVDLRNQGTGVLRAVALGRRWGGPWTFVLKVDFLLKLEDVGLWKRYAPVLQRARYMLADPGEMADELLALLTGSLGGAVRRSPTQSSFGVPGLKMVIRTALLRGSESETGICWVAIHELTHHCARGRKRV